MELNARAPAGPIENRWSDHRFHSKLVNPANRRKYHVIVVGSGLAGGAAAATFGEMGYNVSCFCYQDSPRRAHSIAAQGGINAAKNYQNDGDSTYRLFYDTVKGGGLPSARVERLSTRRAERQHHRSVRRSGRAVRAGVQRPARHRSFGGAQVARTFYARGQTGQQLLLGAYQALERQIEAKTVKMYPRTEMLDLIVIDGRARGIVTRDLVTGKVAAHVADVVVLCSGGYGNAFYLSTNAKGCNASATWRSHRRGACSRTPATRRSTPPAFRRAATINPSSR